MRMRRKRNLEARLSACSDCLLVRGSPCLNLREAEETYRSYLDFEEIFKNKNPVELEVGSGNGGFALKKALRDKDKNLLCVEISKNVILTAMERIRKEGIRNVKFLNIPAEILRCYLPEGSVEKIYLNFSTPLPERSREKQRLTSPRFLKIYSSVLKDSGEIVQKTDSLDFFEYSLAQFSAFGFQIEKITRDLHNSEFAEENIITEYEEEFLKKGKPICMVSLRKRKNT